MLNAVVSPLHGMIMGKRRRKLEERTSFITSNRSSHDSSSGVLAYTRLHRRHGVMVRVCGGFLVFFSKKPPSPPDSKRERASIAGIALQGIGYAVVWSVHRQPFTPFVHWANYLKLPPQS